MRPVIPAQAGIHNPHYSAQAQATMKKGYLYILASKKNGTLYIGVTANLARRMEQHLSKADPSSFTAKYSVNQLVFYMRFDLIGDAICAEKRLKKWKRDYKIRLIQKYNPEWIDYNKVALGFD